MNGNEMNINWYPGHMAKARRMLQDNIKLVDIIIEVLDARAPDASRNPDLARLTAGKKRVIILNKSDLADPAATKQWIRFFEGGGIPAIALDSLHGRSGLQKLNALVAEVSREKREKAAARGLRRVTRAMVAGIPNSGKSTLINMIAGGARAVSGDRPGVTRGKQWIRAGEYFELLDTPGLLWPKQNDQNAARHLAYIGSINDEIIPRDKLTMMLLQEGAKHKPDDIMKRLHIDSLDGEDIIERACIGRGWIMRGGLPDTERACRLIIDEYRAGKLGAITWERPAK